MFARIRSVNGSRSATSASMNASHLACEPLSESETITPGRSLRAIGLCRPPIRLRASSKAHAVTVCNAGRLSTHGPGGQQMSNLAANLVTSAERHADNIALKLDETEIPYAALDAASARVAGLLRDRGLRSGARVGVMLPNVPQFAIVYYGVLRAGGVVVPMNPLLKAREVEFYLSDSG